MGLLHNLVDMWAMGAIMAELLTLHPLFPGTSEADEILKICNVIGCPDEQTWPQGLSLAEAMKYQFPQIRGNQLSEVMKSASSEAVDLISSLCSWDPCKRPKAAEVLQHAFFKVKLLFRLLCCFVFALETDRFSSCYPTIRIVHMFQLLSGQKLQVPLKLLRVLEQEEFQDTLLGDTPLELSPQANLLQTYL
uniref:Protein kinase domain-containing protein n=1 Tax=Aegilops tauschii subsp. strangulata TaxID=200361 RepID=A0A453PCI6_AEGTS